MKKFAFFFGIVLTAIVLVFAGYWLGSAYGFMRDLYSSSVLDEALVDAGFRARILHNLDSGNIDEARLMLRSRLNSDIITISSFNDSADTRTRKLTANVLAGIAASRAKFPSNYTNRPAADEAWVDATIASILEEARKAATK